MTGLRHCRQRAGMRQQDLADQIYVSRSTVANWETGQALPSVTMLPKISAALGCTIDSLYDAPD